MLSLVHQMMLQRGPRNPELYTFPGLGEVLDVQERAGRIYAGTLNGYVLRSDDGGRNWTSYNLTTLIGWVGAVRTIYYSWGFFPNRVRAWGDNGLQAYSDNGGVTWVSENRTTLDTVSDAKETNNFLVGSSTLGTYSVDVGGNMSGGAVSVSNSWNGCARDLNDATHVLVGTGSDLYYGYFGFPPPAGHLAAGLYPKGTTAMSMAVEFDNQENMMFINADTTVGYKNQPAYSLTAPTITTIPSFTNGGQRDITFDTFTNQWAVAGFKTGTSRLWISQRATPTTFVEYDPYLGYNVARWNKIDRDNTRSTWVTGGITTSSAGCIGIWKV